MEVGCIISANHSKHSINNIYVFFIKIITLAFPLGSMNEGTQDKLGGR